MKPHIKIQEKGIVLLTSMLLCFAQSIRAQGNLVVNGNFNVNTNSWVLVNGASWPWGGNLGQGFCVNLSNETPSPSNDPTASQTINSLTPAANYIVSGDYAMGKDYGGGSPSSISFGVFINSVVYFQIVAPGDQNWHSFSFLYTATTSSAILSLSGQMNGTGVSYFIDNISMQAVPEPSTSWLILLGGGLFLYIHKRQRNGHQSRDRPDTYQL